MNRIFLLFALSSTSLFGDKIFTNYGYETARPWYNNHPFWLAQKFQLENSDLHVEKISIDLSRIEGSGQIKVGIYVEDRDGETGELLSTLTTTESIEKKQKRIVFTADKPILLRRKQNYFIAIQTFVESPRDILRFQTTHVDTTANGYGERGRIKLVGSMMGSVYENNFLILDDLHVSVFPDTHWQPKRNKRLLFEMFGSRM